MALTQEMFRFVTTRRPERLALHRINSRLIRDWRPVTSRSLLVELFGPGEYETKLQRANAFAASPDFVRSNDPEILAIEPAVDVFRSKLAPGLDLADLREEIDASYPNLSALLHGEPNPDVLQATIAFVGDLWNSLYTETIRGCDRFVTTNYIADGLRVFHVLGLLWVSDRLNMETWKGWRFDDYHTLIDLERALAVAAPDGPSPSPRLSFGEQQLNELDQALGELQSLQRAHAHVLALRNAGAFRLESRANGHDPVLLAEAAETLAKDSAFEGIDLAMTPVDEVLRQLTVRGQLVALNKQRLEVSLLERESEAQHRATVNRALARRARSPARRASFDALTGQASQFRVELSVGEIRPPVVGDLIVVDQTLRSYGLAELADIKSIMKGERTERSLRNLSRTSQTTTTETLSETEESESFKTEERSQLSFQAQNVASQSFSIDAGVSVSGKFGPVQTSASVNASFSTSKASSESTAQEFAKTVTQEATKRVKFSIKEISSITVLTESQTTSLHGFNNEAGTNHVNGLYRWVDAIYEARLLNYGRRLMLRLTVPDPGLFFRSLLSQTEAALMLDLEEPPPPERVSIATGQPFDPDSGGRGFDSYRDITESNYGRFAALYGVTEVGPPPAGTITGTKAIIYPDAMEAIAIKDHTDEKNELTYVAVDNALTVDPDYSIREIGVFVPTGLTGGHHQYADVLKLGQNKNGVNQIFVEVGHLSFYFRAVGESGGTMTINTNFNVMVEVLPQTPLAGTLQPSLPIYIAADFEGVLALTVLYTADLRSKALDRWKAATYAAIIKGYERRKQEYEQALQLTKAQVQAETESRIYKLRDEQYRSIELTELKRGCIDLLTEGTALGFTSVAIDPEAPPRIVYDEAEGGADGQLAITSGQRISRRVLRDGGV